MYVEYELAWWIPVHYLSVACYLDKYGYIQDIIREVHIEEDFYQE